MRMFTGATGRNVKVAVIDSGVNSRHPHIRAVAGGIAIAPEGAIGSHKPDSDAPVGSVAPETSFEDVLGHGTAVVAVIRGRAPGAEKLSGKVFHRGLFLSIR